MTTGLGFPIRKPVSVWNKPLKANFKDLFKSLSKAAIHGVSGNWKEASLQAVEAFAAIGLATDCGEVAWVLIQRGLIKAIYSIVEDHADLINLQLGDIDELCRNLDLSLENMEVCIDQEFFRNPKMLAIIEAVKIPLTEWLQKVGVSENQSRMISSRLGSYFVFSLNEEWGSNSKSYTCLKEMIDTPFTKAGEREQAWLRYNAFLQKQVEERMFDEAFGLRQVYVPLRGFYEEKIEGEEDKELRQHFPEERRYKRIVINLERTLEDWFSKGDQNDAIRIISGGPGSGKSSFVKIFAANQSIKSNIPILFIPLHHFELTEDLVDAVHNFVSYLQFFPTNPLDPKTGEERLLIIFDGLDELSMQGKVGVEVSQQFIREIDNQIFRFNQTKIRLQVLISGRELVVQEHKSDFKKPQQVLHLLPYFISEESKANFHDPQKLLEQDQRQLWWKLYGEASGKGYPTMPEVLNRDRLEEITAQPLLNYLVALSFARNRLDFSKETNMNAIYNDLIKSVYERGWADHPHPSIAGVGEAEFFRVLEEIAKAAWHGDGRKTTVNQIEAHCKHSGLMQILDKFQEGASKGVTRLLTAFYFRQSGRESSGERTFEFTHKSFCEYLISRRIIHFLGIMNDELFRRKKYIESGWTEVDALKAWAELCGPVSLDDYLFKYILDEMYLQKTDDVKKWQSILCELIGFVLHYGMPMEALVPRPSFQVETRQARNAEEALLVILNACARLTKNLSKIDFPSLFAFGAWIARLQGQRTGPMNVLALDCLGFLDLNNCQLYIRDFYGADFSEAHLNNTKFYLSNLSYAVFRGANLKKVMSVNGNLQGADLSQSILTGANLKNANLRRARLNGADLRDANLEGADIREADLRNADLRGANLKKIKIRGAIFEGANLEGTSLEMKFKH